ncbi:MAG TPA: hypothetical protein VG389_07585 [Myxococcota bacterium]|nr:hypothetical protein [Myxococcota bacterium]
MALTAAGVAMGAAATRPAAALAPAWRCYPVPESARARVAAEIRGRFHSVMDGSAIEVEFGCDPVGDRPREIVMERMEPTVELWRLRPLRGATGVWAALGLAHACSCRACCAGGGAGPLAPPPARMARATLRAGDVTAAIDLARAALVATVREVPGPGSAGAVHGFGSYDPLHERVRLSGSGGVALERAFTGWPNESNQSDYLPALVAAAAVGALLDPSWLTAADAKPGRDARDFFRDRLAAGPAYGAETGRDRASDGPREELRRTAGAALADDLAEMAYTFDRAR